jgi:hypothetical protein
MPCDGFCNELIQDRLGQNNILLGSATAGAPSCEKETLGSMERTISKAWLGDAARRQSVLSKQAGAHRHLRFARTAIVRDEAGETGRGEIVGVAVLTGR